MQLRKENGWSLNSCFTFQRAVPENLISKMQMNLAHNRNIFDYNIDINFDLVVICTRK